MTKDETPKAPPPNQRPKGVAPNVEKVKIEPEAAFSIWLNMGSDASLTALCKHLNEEHEIKISISTINKWSKRYEWVTRREMALEGLDPTRIHQHLKHILALADLPTDKVLHGCINSMAQIVVDAARTKPHEHVSVLTDVMQRIVDMRAQVRGVLMPLEPASGPVEVEKDGEKGNGKTNEPLDLGSFRNNVVEGGSGG